MRLLVLTQRVDANDTNLGVHVRWLQEFAKQCEVITVIAQSVGTYVLPNNVRVFSLGKERGANKLMQLIRLKWLLLKEIGKHDAVFVLMVPLYTIIAGVYAKLLRKPVYLWYTHKHVSLLLRIAVMFVRRVFSASKESFRLATQKVVFFGHAIDTEFFHGARVLPQLVPSAVAPDGGRGKTLAASPAIKVDASVQDPFKLASIGRISPAKHLDILIRAVDVLRTRGKSAQLLIVGDPISEADTAYLEELKRLVKELSIEQQVVFEKGTDQRGVRDIYQSATVAVNASTTGSLDKSVLEAMACECLVVTSNEAFAKIIPADAFVGHSTPAAFADAVVAQCDKPASARSVLREEVVQHHQLSVTLKRLIDTIKSDLA